MTAGYRDITIEQGATYFANYVWKDSNLVPVNLSGYTARMQVRKSYADNNPQLSLTTENGGITLGGPQGTIEVVATADETAAIKLRSGVYDLELMAADGVVKRLLQGNVTVSPEVTR